MLPTCLACVLNESISSWFCICSHQGLPQDPPLVLMMPPALHHPKFHSCLQDVCANTVRSCIRSDTLPDMICLRPLTRKSDILTSHTLSSMINPCGLLPLLFSHPLIACLHYRNSPPILPTESTMPVLIGSLNSPEFNFT